MCTIITQLKISSFSFYGSQIKLEKVFRGNSASLSCPFFVFYICTVFSVYCFVRRPQSNNYFTWKRDISKFNLHFCHAKYDKKKPRKIINLKLHERTIVILFRQTEIVLKDSTAFVYVTQSEKSSHFTSMT